MGRLLVVDDSEFVRLALTDRLEDLGHEVVTAEHGQAALAVLEREEVDLVLLDVNMPVMDGLALLARVRDIEALRGLPVLMLSDRAGVADRVGGLQAGADDYLPKDCDDEELAAKVEAFLRIRRLHDALDRERRQLSEANQQLAAMSRMKEDVTQMIVHDIKNPLGVVMGALEGVRSHLAGEMTAAEAEGLLALAEDRASAILKLAKELLDVSRLEDEAIALELEAVEFRDFTARAIARHAPAATRRGLSIAPLADGEPLLVFIDETHMARVLDNLLGNALKYTQPGGTVSLALKAFSGRRFGERGSRFLEIAVADTGPGIPLADLPRLFDRFFRADARRRGLADGTGLGLHVVKRVVEAHGGWVRVESEPGKGATFRVTVPFSPSLSRAR